MCSVHVYILNTITIPKKVYKLKIKKIMNTQAKAIIFRRPQKLATWGICPFFPLPKFATGHSVNYIEYKCILNNDIR